MAVYNFVSGVVVNKGDSKKDTLKEYVNINAYENSSFSISVLGVPKSLGVEIGDDVKIRCTIRAINSNKGPRVCYFFDSLVNDIIIK